MIIFLLKMARIAGYALGAFAISPLLPTILLMYLAKHLHEMYEPGQAYVSRAQNASAAATQRPDADSRFVSVTT